MVVRGLDPRWPPGRGLALFWARENRRFMAEGLWFQVYLGLSRSRPLISGLTAWVTPGNDLALARCSRSVNKVRKVDDSYRRDRSERTRYESRQLIEETRCAVDRSRQLIEEARRLIRDSQRRSSN